MVDHQITNYFRFYLLMCSGHQRWTTARKRDLSAKTFEMLIHAPTRPYLLDAFKLRGIHGVVVPNPHHSRHCIDVCALSWKTLVIGFLAWQVIGFALAQDIEQGWAKQQVTIKRGIEGVVTDPPIFPGYGDDGINPRILVRIADLRLGKRLIRDALIALDEAGRFDSEELGDTGIGCDVYDSPASPDDRPSLPDTPHHAEKDSLPGRREHD